MLISTIEKNNLQIYDMDLSDEEMELYRKNVGQSELKILADLKKKDVKVLSNPSITIIPKTHPKQVTTTTSDVFLNNRVKVVRAKKGETIESIGKKYSISAYRLRDFNDLSAKENVKEGQLVYLASKKNRATRRKHNVLPYETLWSISQDYAIKLAKLQKRNQLLPNEEPAVGVILFLNRKAKKKPALRNEKDVQEIKEITVPLRNQEEEQKKESIAKTPNEKELRTQEEKPTEIDIHPFNFDKNFYELYAEHLQIKSAHIKYHSVVKGDTLYNISKRYNISIEQLKEWNQLLSNDLALGSILIVDK